MPTLVEADGILVNPFRMAGYDGAENNRKRKRTARNKSRAQDEDRLIGRYDRETLRLECLNLRRNNAVVAGVCERFADNVVGPEGIRPQARTSDESWNTQAENFWAEWCKVADSRGMFSFREIQRLTVQSRLHSGEIGFIFLDNGQLQAIEADRVASPEKAKENIIEGVEVGDAGRPQAYWICNRDKNGYVDVKTAERINARDFVHIFRPLRFDQLRGVPDLSPIINTLADQGDLVESVLLKARLNARRSAIITTERGSSTIGAIGPRNGNSQGSDSGQVYETFGEDTLTYYLRNGEDAKLLSDDTPGQNYVEHNLFLLKMIGAAVSIPYQFLMLDFSVGGAGNNRAALLQTYRTFDTWQAWLKDKMLQRIWNWRIAKAIKNRELPPAPIDARGFSEWYKVDWTPPSYDWMDPQKEAAADKEYYNMGRRTLTSLVRQDGKDVRDVLTEKASEIAIAVEQAQKITAATGIQISWRDLINTTLPGQNAGQVDTTGVQQ